MEKYNEFIVNGKVIQTTIKRSKNSVVGSFELPLKVGDHVTILNLHEDISHKHCEVVNFHLHISKNEMECTFFARDKNGILCCFLSDEIGKSVFKTSIISAELREAFLKTFLGGIN